MIVLDARRALQLIENGNRVKQNRSKRTLSLLIPIHPFIQRGIELGPQFYFFMQPRHMGSRHIGNRS